MTYTPLLVVTLAFVAVTGFSLQDSQSYDSLLSALSAMPDKTPVEYRPGYTSALQQDLGHVDSSSGSRVSRSALRKPVKFPRCCGSGEISEFPEEIISIYPECHPENIHVGETPDEIYDSTLRCLTEQCHAKKIGVVDGEGYVLKDAFVNAVSNWYTEDSLKTLAKQLATKCVAETNALAKEYLDASDNKQRCNQAPYLVRMCLEYFLIAGCPEDLKINNEQCDRTHEYARQLVQDWKNFTRTN